MPNGSSSAVAKPAAARVARTKRTAPRATAAPAVSPTSTATDWLLFIYRVPSEPSNNRVSVWRELAAVVVLLAGAIAQADVFVEQQLTLLIGAGIVLVVASSLFSEAQRRGRTA